METKQRNDSKTDSFRELDQKFEELLAKLKNTQKSPKNLFQNSPNKLRIRPSIIDRAILKTQSDIPASTPMPCNRKLIFTPENSATVSPITNVSSASTDKRSKNVSKRKPITENSKNNSGKIKVTSVITLSSLSEAVEETNKTNDVISTDAEHANFSNNRNLINDKSWKLDNIIRELQQAKHVGGHINNRKTLNKTVQTSNKSLNDLRKLARNNFFMPTARERETQTGDSLRTTLPKPKQSSQLSDSSRLNDTLLKAEEKGLINNSLIEVSGRKKKSEYVEGPWRASSGLKSFVQTKNFLSGKSEIESSLDETFVPKVAPKKKVFANKKKVVVGKRRKSRRSGVPSVSSKENKKQNKEQIQTLAKDTNLNILKEHAQHDSAVGEIEKSQVVKTPVSLNKTREKKKTAKLLNNNKSTRSSEDTLIRMNGRRKSKNAKIDLSLYIRRNGSLLKKREISKLVGEKNVDRYSKRKNTENHQEEEHSSKDQVVAGKKQRKGNTKLNRVENKESPNKKTSNDVSGSIEKRSDGKRVAADNDLTVQASICTEQTEDAVEYESYVPVEEVAEDTFTKTKTKSSKVDKKTNGRENSDVENDISNMKTIVSTKSTSKKCRRNISVADPEGDTECERQVKRNRDDVSNRQIQEDGDGDAENKVGKRIVKRRAEKNTTMKERPNRKEEVDQLEETSVEDTVRKGKNQNRQTPNGPNLEVDGTLQVGSTLVDQTITATTSKTSKEVKREAQIKEKPVESNRSKKMDIRSKQKPKDFLEVVSPEVTLRRSARTRNPPPLRCAAYFQRASKGQYNLGVIDPGLTDLISKNANKTSKKRSTNSSRNRKAAPIISSNDDTISASSATSVFPPIIEENENYENKSKGATSAKKRTIKSGRVTKRKASKNMANKALEILMNDDVPEEEEYADSKETNKFLSIHDGNKNNTIRWGYNTAPRYQSLEDTPQISMTVTISNPVHGYSSGFLKIDPGKSKPKQITNKHSLSFVIIEGEAEVGLQEKCDRFAALDTFSIPKGCEYYIKNLNKKKQLFLSFTRMLPYCNK